MAVVLGALAAVVGVLVTDHTGRDSAVIVAVAVVIAAAWQLSRTGLDDARAQLTSISLGLSGAVLLSTFWESGNDGIWYDFLDEAEIDVFQRFSPAATAMIGAVGVALVATSNAVVRVALRIVIDGDPPTTRIRGGRVIGPLNGCWCSAWSSPASPPPRRSSSPPSRCCAIPSYANTTRSTCTPSPNTS